MIAIIPARGGSKGIPRKNIKLLNNKPLIAYTIEAGLNSNCIEEVIVSTDDPEISEISKQYGASVPFLRPKNLAQDNSSAIDVYLFTISELNRNRNEKIEEFIILLPTSPFRSSSDIDNAYELYKKHSADSLISITDAPIPLSWYLQLDDGLKLKKSVNDNITIKNRQDFKEFYIPNGAIYIFQYDLLLKHRSYYHSKTIGYYMPRNRSVDIDDPLDFKFAEFLLTQEIFLQDKNKVY